MATEKHSLHEKTELMKRIEQQKETLRQLQMVKMYRKKNDLEELQILIDKWRRVCQEALVNLRDKMPEPRPSLTELIDSWNLNAELLKYNEDEEGFDDC